MKINGLLPLLFLIVTACGEKEDKTDTTPSDTETTDTEVETTDTEVETTDTEVETTDTEVETTDTVLQETAVTDTSTTDTSSTDTVLQETAVTDTSVTATDTSVTSFTDSSTTDSSTTDSSTTDSSFTDSAFTDSSLTDTAVTVTVTVTDTAVTVTDTAVTDTSVTDTAVTSTPTGDTALGCLDDVNEPNDTYLDTVPIELAIDPVVTDLSVDFWSVVVGSGDALTVDLTFDNYNVDIFAYDEEGVNVASGTAPGANPESIVLTNSTLDDVVYTIKIRVQGGECTAYHFTLTTDPDSVELCFEDDIGNTIETASPGVVGTTFGYTLGDVPDYYVFTVEPGDELITRSMGSVTFATIRTYDVDGDELGDYWAGYQNHNEKPVDAYVKVFPYGTCNKYEMEVVYNEDVAEICFDMGGGSTRATAEEVFPGLVSSRVRNGEGYNYHKITLGSGDELDVTYTGPVSIELVEESGHGLEILNNDRFANYFEEPIDVVIQVTPTPSEVCPIYQLNLDVTYGTATVCVEDPTGDTNETAYTAVVGSQSGTVVKDHRETYKYTVQSGDAIAVGVGEDAQVGMYDEYGTDLGVERYENTTEFPVDVYIQVYPAYLVNCVGYDLNVSIEEGVAPICSNDSFEPNNGYPVAKPITPGTYSLVVADLDYDWFSISLNDGETIDLTLSWSNSEDAIDLYLREQAYPTSYVSRSSISGSGEELTYTNETGAVLDLFITNRADSPLNGCDSYEMVIDVY